MFSEGSYGLGVIMKNAIILNIMHNIFYPGESEIDVSITLIILKRADGFNHCQWDAIVPLSYFSLFLAPFIFTTFHQQRYPEFQR
jgi:hypothetical protein